MRNSASVMNHDKILGVAVFLVSVFFWIGMWILMTHAVTAIVKANFDIYRGVNSVSGYTLAVSAIWCIIIFAWGMQTTQVTTKELAVASFSVVSWGICVTIVSAILFSYYLDLKVGHIASTTAVWGVVVILWALEISVSIILIRNIVKPLRLTQTISLLMLASLALILLSGARVVALMSLPGVLVRI